MGILNEEHIVYGVVAPATVVLPIMIAIARYSYWIASAKIVFGYLLFCALFRGISFIILFQQIDQFPLLHFYTIVEFYWMCILFRSFFSTKQIRRLIYWMGISFSAFSILYAAFIRSFFEYNTLPRFFASLLTLVLCLYFLYATMQGAASVMFRFNRAVVIALMLYVSVSSILYGLFPLIIRHDELNIFIWNIHATGQAIMYLLIGSAFFKLKNE